MTSSKFNDLKAVLDRYVNILHDLYGFYADATQGFRLYRNYLLPQDGGSSATSHNLTISNSDPDDPNALILNVSNIHDICERNQDEGANVTRVRDYVSTMILEHWNNDIRPAIAAVLGYENPNGVTADIFGDLNKIRNDVLHSRGKANKSTKGIIVKFNEGEKIIITNEIFDKFFVETFNFFNALSKEKTGQAMYSDRSLNQQAKEMHRSMKHTVTKAKT